MILDNYYTIIIFAKWKNDNGIIFVTKYIKIKHFIYHFNRFYWCNLIKQSTIKYDIYIYILVNILAIWQIKKVFVFVFFLQNLSY